MGIVLTAALAVSLAGPLAAEAGAPYKYKQYKIPVENSAPHGITAGPDGNVWFTESATEFNSETFEETNHIGRITPSGDITEFPFNCGCAPIDIVDGADGALYFTVDADFPPIDLGRITTDGVVTFIDALDANGNQLTTNFGTGIVRHGNELWGSGSGALWRYDVLAGHFAEYPVSNVTGELAVDENGTVWYAADGGNAIGSFDPDTGTVGTATPTGAGGRAGHVAVGSDGKVWFTSRFSDAVGYVDPLTLAVQLFNSGDPSGPQDIKADDDGSMWFARAEGGNVVNITPDGVMTAAGKDAPQDSGLEDALGLVVRPDPDGAGKESVSVWFTRPSTNTIGAVTKQ